LFSVYTRGVVNSSWDKPETFPYFSGSGKIYTVSGFSELRFAEALIPKFAKVDIPILSGLKNNPICFAVLVKLLLGIAATAGYLLLT